MYHFLHPNAHGHPGCEAHGWPEVSRDTELIRTFVALGPLPSSEALGNKNVIHVASLEPTGQKNKNMVLYMPITVCQWSVSNTVICHI